MESRSRSCEAQEKNTTAIEVQENNVPSEVKENDAHKKDDHAGRNKKHLARIIPNKCGRIQKRLCQVCDKFKKKALKTIYTCVDCPGSPAVCLGCFRRAHRF